MNHPFRRMTGTILIICCLLSLGGCSTKRNAMRQLSHLNHALQYESDDYTLSDWNDALGQFKQVVGTLEQCRLSSSERVEVRRMEGECIGHLAKGAGLSAVRTVFSIGNEVKAGIEGLLDAITGK